MARVKQSTHPTKHYADRVARYAEGGEVKPWYQRAAEKVVDTAAEMARPQAAKDAAAAEKVRNDDYNKRNKAYQDIWGPNANLPVDEPAPKK